MLYVTDIMLMKYWLNILISFSWNIQIWTIKGTR